MYVVVASIKMSSHFDTIYIFFHLKIVQSKNKKNQTLGKIQLFFVLAIRTSMSQSEIFTVFSV